MLAVNMKMVCECFGGGVPEQIVNIIHIIYNAIRIAVPIILVFVGMLGLGKAISSQKEDEIKKAQQLLVKQFIAGALIFLILSLVTLFFSLVDPDSKTTFGCVNCILNGGDGTYLTPVTNNNSNINGNSNNNSNNNSDIKVTNMYFKDNSIIEMNEGETKEFQLVLSPPYATNKNIKLNYSGNILKIVKREQNNEGYIISIRALNAGQDTIKVISESNKNLTASLTIKVPKKNEVPAYTITQDDIQLNSGDTFNLQAEPNGASSGDNVKIIWSNNTDDSIAVVTKEGHITVKKSGLTNVTGTVYVNDNVTNIKKNVSITVEAESNSESKPTIKLSKNYGMVDDTNDYSITISNLPANTNCEEISLEKNDYVSLTSNIDMGHSSGRKTCKFSVYHKKEGKNITLKFKFNSIKFQTSKYTIYPNLSNNFFQGKSSLIANESGFIMCKNCYDLIILDSKNASFKIKSNNTSNEYYEFIASITGTNSNLYFINSEEQLFEVKSSSYGFNVVRIKTKDSNLALFSFVVDIFENVKKSDYYICVDELENKKLIPVVINSKTLDSPKYVNESWFTFTTTYYREGTVTFKINELNLKKLGVNNLNNLNCSQFALQLNYLSLGTGFDGHKNALYRTKLLNDGQIKSTDALTCNFIISYKKGPFDNKRCDAFIRNNAYQTSFNFYYIGD